MSLRIKKASTTPPKLVKKKKVKHSEEELATYFIDWFKDVYEIFPEVPVKSGIIDFVARAYTNKRITVAVEVKTAFNMVVLEQAIRNKDYCNFSYIAIPHIKGNNANLDFLYRVCKDYGIGVLEFRDDYNKRELGERIKGHVKCFIEPKFQRKLKNEVKLGDWMKVSVAGSRNNRMTAFQNFVIEVTNLLTYNKEKGKLKTPYEEVFKGVIKYYTTLKQFKGNVYTWCRKGVIKEFRYEKGHLILN